jgi:hypothetical protein
MGKPGLTVPATVLPPAVSRPSPRGHREETQAKSHDGSAEARINEAVRNSVTAPVVPASSAAGVAAR